MAEKTKFNGRILMIGYGSVGHCTMPLITRHLDMPLSRVAVVEADDHSEEIAPYVAEGVTYEIKGDHPPEFQAGAGEVCRPRRSRAESQASTSAAMKCWSGARSTAPSISTPASSRGPATTTIRRFRANERSNYHLRYASKGGGEEMAEGLALGHRDHGQPIPASSAIW